MLARVPESTFHSSLSYSTTRARNMAALQPAQTFPPIPLFPFPRRFRGTGIVKFELAGEEDIYPIAKVWVDDMFKNSESFRYKRPFYDKYQDDALDIHAIIIQEFLWRPEYVVVVAKEKLTESQQKNGSTHPYAPTPRAQAPSVPNGDGPQRWCVVAFGAWRFGESSPRRGQFVVDVKDTEAPPLCPHGMHASAPSIPTPALFTPTQSSGMHSTYPEMPAPSFAMPSSVLCTPPPLFGISDLFRDTPDTPGGIHSPSPGQPSPVVSTPDFVDSRRVQTPGTHPPYATLAAQVAETHRATQNMADSPDRSVHLPRWKAYVKTINEYRKRCVYMVASPKRRDS